VRPLGVSAQLCISTVQLRIVRRHHPRRWPPGSYSSQNRPSVSNHLGGPGHTRGSQYVVAKVTRWDKNRNPQRQFTSAVRSRQSELRVQGRPHHTMRARPRRSRTNGRILLFRSYPPGPPQWPYELSRLHAPQQAAFPVELLTVGRTPVSSRTNQFWRSTWKNAHAYTKRGGGATSSFLY
jgi:hypothetical protein